MDPPDPIHEDDRDVVFFDALDEWPSGQDSPESSTSVSASAISDPQSISDDSRHWQPSLADKIRRRPSRRGSFGRRNSSIGCESDAINKARLSFIKQQSFKNPANLDETVNESVVEKCDPIQEQAESSTATNEPREEKDKESTLTAAPENDDTVNATAGSGAEAGISSPNCCPVGDDTALGAEASISSPVCHAVDDTDESDDEAGISSPNFLEFLAGLVIKAVGFQIHLFVMFTTYPLLFLYHSCMLFINPFRTIRMAKGLLMRILTRASDGFRGWVAPPIHGVIGNGKPIGNLALRYGWGLLWSIYVCIVLVSLLVSSLVTSGFMMKFFLEKPIHKKEILNFDYTKQTPVAYVPLMSCTGIGSGVDSENNVEAGNRMEARVIPPRHKVQVTVSLVVPESEYNRNLGIFQVRVDFLSLNGKTISSSSQPAMLRFKSEPVRLVLTFLKMAPVLTGRISETQSLNVKIRGFIEKNDLPTSCLKVTLEHRAEYRPGAGIPELYDAYLILESELPFLKRIMWQWKMSIFIWITMVAFIFEVVLLLLCCRPIIFPRIRRRGGSPPRTTAQNNPPAGSG
ncbi:seipin-2-like [Neltuma alba]|uniref:seipin-2-like n=1 Tax=Neltuma alba TaxID=207710 RepID=UPI0010A46F94|nr:seipin-2-like [Prosopis alba]XP_028755751.1 seipin-2-like [Prosopis alba]XP_028755753.1 seipin-2-like [Prosopis alba]